MAALYIMIAGSGAELVLGIVAAVAAIVGLDVEDDDQ